MKSILLICILFLSQAVIANENNCNDRRTNDYWDDLAIDYADRINVINLVKLRQQLCRQIDTGEISVEKAAKTFERERAWVDLEEVKDGEF